MRLTAAILLVFLLCMPCMAKTDIFGEAREFGMVYGDDTATVHAGFAPLPEQRLSWGLVGTLLLSDAEVDENIHVDSWMAGLYLEYPILSLDSIDPLPSLDSDIFAGVELQYAFERDNSVIAHDDVYFTPYVGWELHISENILTRITYRYNRRDDILGENILSAGICIHW